MDGNLPIIEASSIAISFGAVQALRGVDLLVREATVHALLGQNGAGKSTLIKILTGVYPAGSYDGAFALAGRKAAFAGPAAASASGIGYVPQEVEVLDQLSAAENVFAGRMGLGRSVFIRRRRIEARAREIFAGLGLHIDPATTVASMTSAQRHLVMIARVLASKPRVLLLDEPTASFSGSEVEALFSVVRRLKEQGVTILYITHRLPEVMAICDYATVLRDGRVAATIARTDFDAERFIFAMSGQKLQRMFPAHEPVKTAPKVLEVQDLSVSGHTGAVFGVRGVSFSLAAGEILGLAGLVGSGRSEILHGIYGRTPAGGTIKIEGKTVAIRSPRDARAHGIALLTEDRKRDGLLFNLPVGANITIGNLDDLSFNGFVSSDRESKAILAAMRQLSVKAASPSASVAHLSGGNQQKLLFARALMRTPKVLLLDEPTKGVDASTRYEIYRLIVDLAGRGVGLIVVASELEEVLGLCDRCLTIADGRIVDEFLRGDGGEDRVLRAVAAAQAETVGSVQ